MPGLNLPFAPDTRRVRRDGLPPVREFRAEICVVGAGIAGTSAAIEAARLGRKTVVVDGLPALGGQAVNGIIGMFCGLFGNGTHGPQFTHGIADDILRDLGAEDALHYRRAHTTVVMYDDVALARWVERTIVKEGVIPLVGAILRNVNLDGRRIASLDFATRYGDVRIVADGFIDASGDAALTWQAGLACQEQADGVIYGSQMMVIEGVDEAQAPTWDEMGLRIRERGEHYGLIRRDGFAAAFPGRGIAVVNMNHVETPLDPFGATAKGLEGREQADRTMQFLKGEFPAAYGNTRVRALGLRPMKCARGPSFPTVSRARRGRSNSTTTPKATCGSRSAKITCTTCRSRASRRSTPTISSRPAGASTPTAPRSRACASWARALRWARRPRTRSISPVPAASTISTWRHYAGG